MIITGTSGNDNLSGTDAPDQISGLDGDDFLSGGASDDLIAGGPGNDNLSDSHGNDTLQGGTGNDALLAGLGNDAVSGGDGSDTLVGGEGSDQLSGGGGDDVFYDGGHSDNTGADTLDGGAGADSFRVGYLDAPIVITGGTGQDLYTLFNHPALGIFNSTITDFAAGLGGDRIDVDSLLHAAGNFVGYQGGNPFDPANAVLRLTQSGPDTLLEWNYGGFGGASPGIAQWRPVLTLQNVDATSLTSANFVGGIPPDGSPVPGDTLTGTAGDDSLVGTFFNDSLTGLDGDDTLVGHGGADTLRGGIGADLVIGGAGSDVLNGGAGDDKFVVAFLGTNTSASGGSGIDTYEVYGSGGENQHRGYFVQDFTVGAGGDRIDVWNLLDASAAPPSPGSTPYIAGNPFHPSLGYLRLVQNGADTELQWDSDGAPDSLRSWITVLTLKNVSAGSLTAENFLGIPPDGSTVGGSTLTGGAGNDTLQGAVFDDSIAGLDGDDVLRGRAGNDVVRGGTGDDLVLGDLGNDTLNGGDGNDAFSSNDRDIFGIGSFNSEFGDDHISGGSGNDSISDGFGHNIIDAGSGDDVIGLGGDVFGGEVVPNLGASTVTGGAGVDRYFVQGSHVDQSHIVTDFTTGAGGDLIEPHFLGFYGFTHGNPFDLGFMRLAQSEGNVLLQWDKDGAAGGAYTWVTQLTLQNVAVSSITSDNFAGQLKLGTDGNDDLFSGPGNDTIVALAGNDTLDGSAGADSMVGGPGNDVYFVDAGADLVLETANTAGGALPPGAAAAFNPVDGITDTVISAIDFSLAALPFVENVHLAGSALNATGNALDNELFGNELANSLVGGLGDDSLVGRGGDDFAQGSAGSDTVRGSAGNDILRGGADGDEIYGGQNEDQLFGGQGADLLRGALGHDALGAGQGNDTLGGGLGDDELRGGLGNDDLTGGLGADTFVFTSAGAADADLVHGFLVAEGDVIRLDAGFFAGASLGTTLVYDAGELAYNGALIATFDGAPAITAGDIFVF